MRGWKKMHCKYLTYILIQTSFRSRKFRTGFFAGATRLACPLSFRKISVFYLRSVLNKCLDKKSSKIMTKWRFSFPKTKNGYKLQMIIDRWWKFDENQTTHIREIFCTNFEIKKKKKMQFRCEKRVGLSSNFSSVAIRWDFRWDLNLSDVMLTRLE